MLVTVAEAAEMLKVSPRAIRKQIAAGNIQIRGWRTVRGKQTCLICVDLRKTHLEGTTGGNFKHDLKHDKKWKEPAKTQLSQLVTPFGDAETWLSTTEISSLQNITVQAVHQRAKREAWPVKKSDTKMVPACLDGHAGIAPSERTTLSLTDGVTGGSPLRRYPLSSLPVEARRRYLEKHKANLLNEAVRQVETPDDITALAGSPPEQAADAVRKLRWVREAIEIQKLSSSECRPAFAGSPLLEKTTVGGRAAFLEKVASQAGVSYATLLRWVAAYKKEGIVGLVPKERGHQKAVLDDEAKKLAFTLYADRQQPSYQQVHVTLAKKCKEQGRPVPSYTAMYRFLKGVSPAAIDYWRKGGEYVRRNYVPPILRLLDDLTVNEVWMGDATTLDVFCTYPGRPNPVRPCLTAWMDVRSRLIVGYLIALSVDTNAVALAFRDAALKYGLPEVVYIDNGKEYKNKNWCGQTISYGHLETARIKGRWERLGVMPMYAWPYSPQSKSQIERWFNTISHGFLNLLPGYSGANITAKTLRKDQERLAKEIKQGALLSFDELVAAIGEAIEAYNHKQHRSLENKSPAQTSLDGFGLPRLVSERQLDFCLAKQKVATIKSGGITIRDIGTTYISHDPAFIRNIGRPGIVAYDQRDPSKAHLSAIVNGREVYCCAIQPREGIAFRASEADLKEAIIKKRKVSKLIAEAAHAMKVKTVDVRAELQEANFAADPAQVEEFRRGIAIKKGAGNVVQLVPMPPKKDGTDEKKVRWEGLFGEAVYLSQGAED